MKLSKSLLLYSICSFTVSVICGQLNALGYLLAELAPSTRHAAQKMIAIPSQTLSIQTFTQRRFFSSSMLHSSLTVSAINKRLNSAGSLLSELTSSSTRHATTNTVVVPSQTFMQPRFYSSNMHQSSIAVSVISEHLNTAGSLLSEPTLSPAKHVVQKTIVVPGQLPTQTFMQRRFASSGTSPQLYGIATYDALFKHVLSNDNIRPSFFHAFIPGLPIVASERLDDHMNPVQSLQLLRTLVHSKKTEDVVESLAPVSDFEVSRVDSATKKLEKDEKATAFLREMISRFEEIKHSFPRERFDGTMDFRCRLANNDYALVEMQIIPQNSLDKRLLAYAAWCYSNQLFKGEEWKDIKKVIGINILGGGKENKAHWVDTPDQFVRHYKVQEQLHKPARYINGIELIQYSLMNAPKALDNQEQQDWITFFKDGHYMTEEQVQQKIKTPAVLEAFKHAKIKSLPVEVLAAYEAEDKDYDRYSEHTAELVKEGEKEGRKEGREEGRKEGKESMLRKLFEKGVITEEEFNKEKADLEKE